MTPQQEIQALQQAIAEIVDVIEGMIQNGEVIDEGLQDEISNIIETASERISEIQGSEPDIGKTEGSIPQGSELLWLLAGGQPEAFVNYLRTFPDPRFKKLLTNPSSLQNAVEFLEKNFPVGQPPVEDGIQKAPLESSNIYGFQYDPERKNLLVRFQSGSIYGYENVPPYIFNIFQQGAIPAKTEGENEYGRWWIGKQPSLGASFYNLIRNGGYPYQRVA